MRGPENNGFIYKRIIGRKSSGVGMKISRRHLCNGVGMLRRMDYEDCDKLIVDEGVWDDEVGILRKMEF